MWEKYKLLPEISNIVEEQQHAPFDRLLQFLTRALFFLLIVFIPSNLFWVITERSAFVSGLRVDYLIPKLYFSIVLALLIIVVQLIAAIKKSGLRSLIKAARATFSSHKWAWLLLSIFFVRQFFTASPLVSIWFLIQLLIVTALGWVLYQQRWLLEGMFFCWAVFTSLVVQTGLAIYQFAFQQPLLPYYIFGESRFEPYFRMSRHQFNGQEKILAYGSTPHPNVLAGVGVIFFIILCQQLWNKHQQKIWGLWKPLAMVSSGLLAVAIIIYTTQSLSALLSLVFAGVFIVLKSTFSKLNNLRVTSNFLLIIVMMIMVVVPVFLSSQAQQQPNNPSIVRREQLNLTAMDIFKKHWPTGVGLGQFTVFLEEFAPSKEIVRFVQPAHHVGLLWLAETGVLGIMLMIAGYKKLASEQKLKLIQWLLILSPILALDHYLYTIQIGQLILVLLFSQVFSSLQDQELELE